MGIIVEFLTDNFMIVAFIAIILVLALIGYIVDSAKNKDNKDKVIKNEEKPTVDVNNIPKDIKLGETVNQPIAPVKTDNTPPAPPLPSTPPPIATIEPPTMKVDGPPEI